MGLADRQAMAVFKDKKLAAQLAKLKTVVGADIAIEIDESTELPKGAVGMLPNAMFDRLCDDLKKVCTDDLGRQAVRDAIKKVVVKYTTLPKSPSITLDAGALIVVGKWEGSPGADYPGYDDYKKYLLAKL